MHIYAYMKRILFFVIIEIISSQNIYTQNISQITSNIQAVITEAFKN